MLLDQERAGDSMRLRLKEIRRSRKREEDRLKEKNQSAKSAPHIRKR